MIPEVLGELAGVEFGKESSEAWLEGQARGCGVASEWVLPTAAGAGW